MTFTRTLALLLAAFWVAFAGEPGGIQSPTEATAQTDADWVDDRWTRTEIGTFLGATIDTPRKRTPKAIAIRIGEDEQATACFDTDLLRYSAVWTGGFLDLKPQRYGLIAAPSPQGEILFTTQPGPGWAREGNFADPRPGQIGRLPKEHSHYKGLHLSGKRVVLKYTVGALTVFDSPWFDDPAEFSRSLALEGTGSALLRVCDEPGAIARLESPTRAVLVKDGKVLRIGAIGGELRVGDDGTVNLDISSDGRTKARIVITTGVLRMPQDVPDLEEWTKGGAPRWLPELETRGHVDRGHGALAIDTLTLPYANPWNALFFTSGHDFLSNGDAAVATIHGDVWLVSGIDSGLQNLKWKRFATGLYQPLGLRVLDDKIYVLERDQITILHDLNGDREADYYENFNNDCISGGGGHSYAACLETDAERNFYFVKCAEGTPHGGTLLKVSADGGNLEVLATGFRNPNGLGVGPDGTITVADQQGEWVPETRLDVITPGGFYGYMPMHKRPTPPARYDAPLCWIPRVIDNSAGGQVWVPPGQWDDLDGKLLHLSYGRSTAMLILRDQKNGGVNGGIASLPGRYLSGVMRGRFNPADGALYVTGMRGWQTSAIKDGCLQRVRRTGTPIETPIGFAIDAGGLELTFARELDASLAGDSSSYAAEQWNYRWTAAYGSPDFSLRDPEKKARDKMTIRKVTVISPKTVRIEFEEPLRPVDTLALTYNLETTSQEELRGTFYCTVNQVE